MVAAVGPRLLKGYFYYFTIFVHKEAASNAHHDGLTLPLKKALIEQRKEISKD